VSLQNDDRKGFTLERRLAITYAVSTSIMLSAACVAVATVSGGLFVQAAPGLNAGIKKVEMIDDYIVLHSPTTSPSTAEVTKAYIVAPAAALVPDPTVPPSTDSAPEILNVQPPAPAPAPVHKAAPAVAPMPAPAPTPVVHEQHRISPPTTDGTPNYGQPTSTHHHSGGGSTGGGGDHGGGGGGDD
jgi:uncharacterized membrane protein YgcG